MPQHFLGQFSERKSRSVSSRQLKRLGDLRFFGGITTHLNSQWNVSRDSVLMEEPIDRAGSRAEPRNPSCRRLALVPGTRAVAWCLRRDGRSRERRHRPRLPCCIEVEHGCGIGVQGAPNDEYVPHHADSMDCGSAIRSCCWGNAITAPRDDGHGRSGLTVRSQLTFTFSRWTVVDGSRSRQLAIWVSSPPRIPSFQTRTVLQRC